MPETTSTYLVTTIAGTGTGGSASDGDAAIRAQLNQPIDMAFDSLGNLYIAEQGNRRIRKVDKKGTATTVTIHGETLNFNGLAIDTEDNLYISDWKSNRVYRVDRKGNLTTSPTNRRSPIHLDWHLTRMGTS